MPKIVDHALVRQELLAKAFDLFAEKGYGSLSMRELAKGLGVSMGSLYHYFPSKKDLFWQLMEHEVLQDVKSFMQDFDPQRGLIEQIEKGFACMAEEEERSRKQVLLWMEFVQQQGREEVLQESQALKTLIADSYRQIAAQLGLDDLALMAFWDCLMVGILMQRFVLGDITTFAEQGQLLARMLSAYLDQIRHDPNYQPIHPLSQPFL
ncbi:MAG: TetR/AcrR family transcriptional regulator [Cyanobacteriota bacterium]|nr:TetR/AcrR family transcriptional regulator [Cyanobacteriota bacterium]